MALGMSAYCDRLVQWLKAQVQEAGASGAVIGVSGGVDSAVVAALSKRAFPCDTLGVIMPCKSLEEDIEDARLVGSALGVPCREVDLAPVFDLLLEVMGPGAGGSLMAKANLKPRLRMLTLYYHANNLGYLVLGTSNRSEMKVGYFTKYGDGGSDLLPLARMVKVQVWEAASVLGVPERVIRKPPSAGLWPGQTDEAEMGITYEVLDRYLLTGEAPSDALRAIETMAARSAHKLRTPLIPEFSP